MSNETSGGGMSALRLIRVIAIALSVFASGYLLGAFMAWDWNPGNWDSSARSLGGLMLGALGVIAAIVCEAAARP